MKSSVDPDVVEIAEIFVWIFVDSESLDIVLFLCIRSISPIMDCVEKVDTFLYSFFSLKFAQI